MTQDNDPNPTSANTPSDTSRRGFLKAAGLGGAVGVSVLAGCSGGGGGGSGGGDDTFKLGAVLPLSQGWGPLGSALQRAAQLRIDRINSNGGLRGAEVEMLVEDTQVDPDATVQKTNRLIKQDNVDFLFGPINSSIRNAMGPVLESESMPLLYPVFYEGAAGEDYCNENIYKFGEVPEQLISPFIPWLVENRGTDFYLLGSDYIWPQATNGFIKDRVAEEGGEVLGEEYVPLGETEFTSIIPRIEEADPDVLLMTLTGQSVVSMQKQMQNRGVRGNWQDIQLAGGQGVISAVPAEALTGMLSVHAYFELLDTAANNEFVSDFRSEYGSDALINYSCGTADTAVQMLRAAVEQAGSTDTADIQDAMNDVQVESIMGQTVSLTEDQQLDVGCTIAEVEQDQKYHPVETLERADLQDRCESI